MAAQVGDENLQISSTNGRLGSSPKEKFDAAVNVIQGLPKNGSFQPSHEMMLRFYGYYKQATLGPCNIPKPWSWDVVAKAKWNAWSSLGDLPREEAMLLYVNELKQIVETMPQTDQVAEFIEKLGSFYEIVDERNEPVRSPVKSVRKPAFEGLEKLMAKAEIHLNGNGAASESESEVDSDKDVDTTEIRETIEHHRIVVTESATSHDSGIGLSDHEVISDHNANSKKPMNGARPRRNSPPTVNNGGGQGHRRALPAISSDTDSEAEFCDSTDHIQSMPELVPAESASYMTRTSSPSSVNHSVTHHVSSQSLPYDRQSGPIMDAVVHRGGGDDQTGRGDRRLPSRSSASPRTPSRPMPDQSYRGSPPPVAVGAVGGAGGEFPGRGGVVPAVMAVDPQIAATLLRMQQDMNDILAKLNTLERHVLAQRHGDDEHALQRRHPAARCWWWPFGNLPLKTVAVILAWPILLQLVFKLVALLRKRRRRK